MRVGVSELIILYVLLMILPGIVLAIVLPITAKRRRDRAAQQQQQPSYTLYSSAPTAPQADEAASAEDKPHELRQGASAPEETEASKTSYHWQF